VSGVAMAMATVTPAIQLLMMSPDAASSC
jgi:hypothetical protein